MALTKRFALLNIPSQLLDDGLHVHAILNAIVIKALFTLYELLYAFVQSCTIAHGVTKLLCTVETDSPFS